MEKETKGNFLLAFQEAQQDFAARSPEEMAAKSGAVFREGCLNLNYCGRDYFVLFPAGEVIASDGEEVLLSDKVLILHYLTQADGALPQGKWLALEELPGGFSHLALFQKEALLPLAQTFGPRPELLLSAVRHLGGKEAPLGDYGGIIPAFPHLPLGVFLWKGDHDFPPAAGLLFDNSALHYLDTAGLYVLGVNTALKLCRKVAGI